MRIAHILWTLGTGGTENMVVDIANVQSETEDVAIFVINDLVEQYIVDRISPKCKLYLFNRKAKSKNLLPLVKFNIRLSLFSPDIIHIHARQLLRCVKLCKSVPKVRTLHGLIYHPEELIGFNKLFSISEAVRQHTLQKGFDSSVVLNGIKFSDISNKKTNPFVDGKIHIVQVGRLHIKTKGQDLLIKAVANLCEQGYNNVVVHLIGDGSSKPNLEKLVAELGMQEHVIFEGRKDQHEIYKTLANYDIFVQPSREEGFGLTIAEAMAAKIPVIVSDIAAPMEVIKNGELGLFFKKNDANDLAEKIKICIDAEYDLQKIEDAYNFAKDSYDVSATANRYIDEYKTVIGIR